MEAPGMRKQLHRDLIAGINAAMEVLGKEPLILDRSEAYIGVLIDDLVTKENTRAVSNDDFQGGIPSAASPG